MRHVPLTDSDLQCFNVIESLKEIILECPPLLTKNTAELTNAVECPNQDVMNKSNSAESTFSSCRDDEKPSTSGAAAATASSQRDFLDNRTRSRFWSSMCRSLPQRQQYRNPDRIIYVDLRNRHSTFIVMNSSGFMQQETAPQPHHLHRLHQQDASVAPNDDSVHSCQNLTESRANHLVGLLSSDIPSTSQENLPTSSSLLSTSSSLPSLPSATSSTAPSGYSSCSSPSSLLSKASSTSPSGSSSCSSSLLSESSSSISSGCSSSSLSSTPVAVSTVSVSTSLASNSMPSVTILSTTLNNVTTSSTISVSFPVSSTNTTASGSNRPSLPEQLECVSVVKRNVISKLNSAPQPGPSILQVQVQAEGGMRCVGVNAEGSNVPVSVHQPNFPQASIANVARGSSVPEVSQVMRHDLFWDLMNPFSANNNLASSNAEGAQQRNNNGENDFGTESNGASTSSHSKRQPIYPRNFISDQGLCAYGRSLNPLNQGRIWISIRNRPDNTKIERLIVRNYTLVTDMFLRHIVQCSPHLNYLDVSGTSITQDGINLFKIAKPECEVIAEHLK